MHTNVNALVPAEVIQQPCNYDSFTELSPRIKIQQGHDRTGYYFITGLCDRHLRVALNSYDDAPISWGCYVHDHNGYAVGQVKEPGNQKECSLCLLGLVSELQKFKKGGGVIGKRK